MSKKVTTNNYSLCEALKLILDSDCDLSEIEQDGD